MADTKKKRGPGRPSGSKNKNSKSSQSKSKSKQAETLEQQQIYEMQEQRNSRRKLIDEIWGIVIFAISVFLIFTSGIVSTGTFGKGLHNILKGLFGGMANFLPYFLIVVAVCLFLQKLQHINGRTASLTLLIYLMMCSLNGGRYVKLNNIRYGFGDILKFYRGGVHGKNAGAVGMELANIFVKLIGKPGLIILSMAVICICLLLVVNTPLSKQFQRLKEVREEKKIMKELERQGAKPVPVPTYEDSVRNNPNMKEAFDLDNDVKFSDSYLRQGEDFEDPLKANAENSAYNKSSNGGITNLSDDGYTNFSADPSKDDEPTTGLFGRMLSRYLNSKRNVPVNTNDSLNTQRKYEKNTQTKKSEADIPDEKTRRELAAMLDKNLDFSPRQSAKTTGLENSTIPATGFGLDGGSVPKKAGLGLDGGSAAVAGAAPGLGLEGEPARKKKSKISEFREPDSEQYEENTKSLSESNEKPLEKEDNRPTKADHDEIIKEVAAGKIKKDSNYLFPSVELLRKPKVSNTKMTPAELESRAHLLERTLSDFNVEAKVLNVTEGASVTRYEVQPATGVKVSKITGLADDIALNMRARSIRMEAPIPGKAAVGIEIENENASPVLIRELIESREFREAKSKISFVVGKDVSGRNIVADLHGMPHMLIAGATGSGKSVCINTIITSILYKASPDEVKLVLIDPKVVELGNYNGIPHMLIPVVTDPKKAAAALNWAVNEMQQRYNKFAEIGAKDLSSYNSSVLSAGESDNVLPQIVIIIDELADLMMAASSQVEEAICRLAQKARAAGMHLIVATQRPSVDVVTGLIKANIPSRIAFSVSSQFDSRTIIDMAGAEKLLGKGDMLFSPVEANKPIRVQGPFISEKESADIIEFVKTQGETQYREDVIESIEVNDKQAMTNSMEDELTEDAIEFILKQKQASVSMLQRRFRIGYNRAARIIDEIEAMGIIGPSDGSRPRQLLVTEEEYYGPQETFVSNEKNEDSGAAIFQESDEAEYTGETLNE